MQLHEDASDEMCLLDDSETVPHAVGDVFFVDTCEQVTAIVEATKEELQQEMTNAGADIDSITARLGDLKRTLYAKFGNVRVHRRMVGKLGLTMATGFGRLSTWKSSGAVRACLLGYRVAR